MAFYEHIKYKLRQESELPKGFSFEEMKDGIYVKMPPKQKKRRNFIFFWWFGAGLLLSLGGYLLYSSHNNVMTSRNLKKVDDSTHPSIDMSRSKTSNPVEYEKVLPHLDKNSALNAINKKTTSNNSSKAVMNASNTKANFNKSVQGYEIHPNLGSNEHATTFQFDDKTQVAAINPEQSSILNTTKSESIKFAEEEIEQISLLPRPITQLEYQHPIPEMGVKLIIPLPKRNKPSWSVEAGGGFIAWNGHYQQYDTELSTGQKSNWQLRSSFGYQGNVMTDVHWVNGLYLTSGIEFQKRYSQFDYEGISKSNTILENQIIKIEQSLLSGVKSEIRGNANATITSQRKLRKNNIDQIIRVPLIVGFTKSMHHWSIQGGIGMSVNIWSQHSGTTVVASKLEFYDRVHPLWNPEWQFNIESHIKVKYFFGKGVFLGTSIAYSKPLQDQNLADNVTWRPSVFSLSAFAGYQF